MCRPIGTDEVQAVAGNHDLAGVGPPLTLGDDLLGDLAAFAQVLRRVETRLSRDPAVTTVVPPRAGVSISADRHAALIQAGSARQANDMVRAADAPAQCSGGT